MPCDYNGDDCKPTLGGALLTIALTLGTWIALFFAAKGCAFI